MRQVNDLILRQASKLQYSVASKAPSTIVDLFNQPTLVIWNGASQNTIFQDETVNWAFRALHDTLHLKTRIGFTVAEEIELGRIQASQYTGLMADLVYCEVSEQAKYYLKNGIFVPNQVEFTKAYLTKLGWKI